VVIGPRRITRTPSSPWKRCAGASMPIARSAATPCMKWRADGGRAQIQSGHRSSATRGIRVIRFAVCVGGCGLGEIGKVHNIHAGCNAFKNVYCRFRTWPRCEKHEVPATLDYDLWWGRWSFALTRRSGCRGIGAGDALWWRDDRRLDYVMCSTRPIGHGLGRAGHGAGGSD